MAIRSRAVATATGAEGQLLAYRENVKHAFEDLQVNSRRSHHKAKLAAPAAAAGNLAAETTSQPQVIDVYLQPGEFYFGDANTRIKTLLGSCVAITLWHPGKRLGGMCHYLLPTRDRVHREELDGRYADEALGLFLIEIARSGLPPQEYEAKIFGGGNMFPDSPAKQKMEVGARNAAHGLRVLQGLGFNIKSNHLNGTGHRNLVFEVWSGDVWMRYSKVAAEA